MAKQIQKHVIFNGQIYASGGVEVIHDFIVTNATCHLSLELMMIWDTIDVGYCKGLSNNV